MDQAHQAGTSYFR